MSELLTYGSRLAQGIAGAAIAGAVAIAPRMGRGTRPMPIDRSVQRDVVVHSAPEPVPARGQVHVEPRLDPTPRTA